MASKQTKDTETGSVQEKPPKLMGGWMPKEWWGKGREPGRRIPMAEEPADKPALTAERVAYFRRETNWLRAVIQDNVKRDQNFIPFRLETTNYLPGENYFLVLCQIMYRERECKRALGEKLEGEDFINRLVHWWSQTPLTTDYVYGAMNGTSVDDAEEDEHA